MQKHYNTDIRDRMQKGGFSQIDVAIFLGVHRLTVWEWLRAPLTIERRLKIETALDEMERQEGAAH